LSTFFKVAIRMSVENEIVWLRFMLQVQRENAAIERMRSAA